MSKSEGFGAGVGAKVGLKKLFNDNSEEAKLLANQLETLKNHIGGNFHAGVIRD